MDAIITGWGHTRFGRHEESFEALLQGAAREALEHAGVQPDDVDAIFLGHFNAGMVADAFASSLVLGLDESLRFTPATRLENACASGSAAVYAARDFIRAGSGRVALVIGAEKMSEQDTAGVTRALAGAAYQAEEAGLSFPQIFGRIAQGYFQAYGNQSDVLARIAAKNHANAMHNPLAQMHKPLDFTFCNTVSDKNPLIAPPLRMSDCSLVRDGAAALVMVADDMAQDFPRAVGFRAVQVNDFLPLSRRDMTELAGAQAAFSGSFDAAGVTVDGLDVADVHDCFTIAELLIYKAMGLTAKGQGRRAIEEGRVAAAGDLPVNLSGGLKAKGHPVGATGVSMHVMAARQVTGEAGAIQRPGAALGCVFNMGGAGVANYCSVLEVVK